MLIMCFFIEILFFLTIDLIILAGLKITWITSKNIVWLKKNQDDIFKKY